MQKMYIPARIAAIFIVISFILTIYVSALYNVQVFQPRQYQDENIQRRIITRTSTIAAARGNIYDRNGVLLASGRPSYNVRLDWHSLRGMPEANDVVLEMIYAATDAGITYTDTFPVTRGAPFEFLSNMSTTQRNRLDTYFKEFRIKDDVDVSSLLSWFRDHYNIDSTVNILDARLIIGVRYELEIRAIIGSITPYIFASDVSTDFVSYLAERNLTGVYTETAYVREYHTTHAPHVLGYIGRMTETEYEYYKEKGYPMTAMVGKVGVEYAFEEYLHGVEGERKTLLNEEGTVLSDEILTQPQPGQHIYLTLDLDLQIAAENALRTTIEEINTERREAYNKLEEDDEEAILELIPGGAVVVTDINTGEILACVSYPGYNLSTLSQDWAYLNTDPDLPMFNRATMGRYQPGSTFKMVTALAALRNVPGFNRYTQIYDTGRFDKYYFEDNPEGSYIAHCWTWPTTRMGHEWVDMTSALECSCNYYFVDITDRLAGGNAEGAAEMLMETARDFGFGLKTGIELPEYEGRLPDPAVKRELYAGTNEQGWFTGDILQAGFGQGLSRFTPLQLVNYAATLGNGGTVYRLSFLKRIISSDFSETLFEQEKEILNEIEDTEYLDIIKEGMRATVTGRHGTARDVFGNYRIPVAAKTGTVQVEGAEMNDGLFVCYAPADNPEIAISVVVEKGGSGSGIMIVARRIMERYFVTESNFQATPYWQMIP